MMNYQRKPKRKLLRFFNLIVCERIMSFKYKELKDEV